MESIVCDIRAESGLPSLEETAEAIRNGDVSADDFPPIRLAQREDRLYTLDNRRLVTFQKADLSDIPYRMATPEEEAAESWKFDTKTNGASIRIRGTGEVWSP
jgi:hypothetical protein